MNRATYQGSTRLPWESALKLTAFSVQLVLSSLQSSSIFNNYLLHQVGELITGWIHSAMWNNASHLAMITFFIANTLLELGYFYKVTTLSLIPSHYSFIIARLQFLQALTTPQPLLLLPWRRFSSHRFRKNQVGAWEAYILGRNLCFCQFCKLCYDNWCSFSSTPMASQC